MALSWTASSVIRWSCSCSCSCCWSGEGEWFPSFESWSDSSVNRLWCCGTADWTFASVVASAVVDERAGVLS